MRISDQFGSLDQDMQIDKGEENAGGALDKTDDLNIKISDSFLTCIRLMLAWDKNQFLQSIYNDKIKYQEQKTAQNQLTSAKNSKMVPTELHLLTLTIGNKKKVMFQLCYEKLTRRVDIPFSDITSLLVCFDHGGVDTLRIEARSPLKYFLADKLHPQKFTHWKIDDYKGDYCFPESKFVFLEIEKGMLEKGLAKLILY